MAKRTYVARVWRTVLWITTVTVTLTVYSPLTAQDQASSITRLAAVKKPGHADGKAMATVKGPTKVRGKVVVTETTGRIATNALQAWTILDGQGALLLLSPEKKGQQYRLRYYQLDAGKGRLLGHVPFAEASVVESKAPWAFAISGTDPATKRPVIFVGDTEAVHAELRDASGPHFSAGSLTFQSSGEDKNLDTALLLGQEAAGIIYAPSRKSSQVAYLQFLPDGDSITVSPTGQVEHGRWTTDGSSFQVGSEKEAVWRLADLETVLGVPATTRLTVRLSEPLSSRTARKGMAVKSVLISPAVVEGAILIPQGSEFDGRVVEAHGVGLALKHETAALTIQFDSVTFPDGHKLPIDARIFKVDNSREDVTKGGKIEGVRSTGTLGYSAENKIGSLAQVDPIAYIFTGSAGPAVLGFAEPEILYNAGTELIIQFNKPVITAQEYPPRVPRMNLSGDQLESFHALMKELPFRTRTETTHKPSDITNLVFIGKPDALRRAFAAAGWTTADTLTAAATFQTVKTLAGNQTYTQAPMSMLLLGDEKPLFTMQKTTNTFSSRHHLRVFPTAETFDGETVLTASSTQDIGIAFSYKQKTFIHVIDQNLDNERSKVTNDLEFTGCVDSIDLVPRPWVPRDAYNSTGDRLITDGDAAVLRINDCTNPDETSTAAAFRAPLYERSERNTMLAIKDTLYRGNLVYTGIAGGIKVHNYFATQGELGEETGNWQKNDASGTQYKVAGAPKPLLRRRTWGGNTSTGPAELDAQSRASEAAHKWDPPHFEIGLNLGYSGYSNFSDQILEFTLVGLESSNPQNPQYFIALGDAVADGWAAGFSLTLNSWNWVSNEFSYMRQQNKFDLVALSTSWDPDAEPEIDSETVGLVTRRFAYNSILNLRPRKSRWRPYISAGPAFQLLALSNAPLKQPSGYFRLGLSNIGLIKAAFDFGNTPPLNGGGIFQFGLQYGVGFKFRVTPRFTMRTDFGETWSPNPSIIRDSYLGYEPIILDSTYTTTVANLKAESKFIQQRGTVGFAFTF